MNLQQARARFIPQINAEMRHVMAPPGDSPDPFFGMMHYHLGWVDPDLRPVTTNPGKQLRPLFTLLCCRAAGGNPEQALPAAAAVELVHNFSLIHDDIEDNSLTRRGRPTVWAIWGNAQAINAGDALFTLARNALLNLQSRGVSLPTIFTALNRLDQTCLTLCRGQYLDMSFEQTPVVGLEAYLDMIDAKTAALLACAGFLGGLVATADAARAEIFGELGRALGLAFQIHDDLLGIWGDESVTGKPAADDLRRRKKSLPVVFALNQPDSRRAARFKEIYRSDTLREADITEAVALLEAAGAKTYTEQQAQEYVERAQTALNAINTPAANKQALEELARFLIERAH
ncbi:MAG: polyprenyl synthetase family protein [Anaerolineae bacterium]